MGGDALTTMITNLFVYGTLRRNAQRDAVQQAAHEKLARHSRWLGTATVDGKLYPLGEFFVLVYPERERVPGEVYAVDPAQWRPVIEYLDDYEGSDYRRDVVQAQLDHGEMISAWAYLLNRAS